MGKKEPRLDDRPLRVSDSTPRGSDFSTDGFALKLGLFYAAYFLFGGIQLPFFPLWLEAKGFDASTIGLVIAIATMVRIVATPVAAHQADRRQALKSTLLIGTLGGTLMMTAVGLLDGTLAIFITFALAAAFFSPLLAIADAYALSGLRSRGRAYGPVRLWGSVAFIVANVGAGFLLDVIAPDRLIWLIVAGLFASVLAAAALVPLEPLPAVAGAPAAPKRRLWHDPAFVAIAAAASLAQGSHALYYGFSTLEWRAAGFDGATIGLLWGLGVAAEIVLFAFSARLPPAFSPTVLLMIGAGGGVLRWAAMAFAPPVALLPVLQCLHALSFGAAHLGAMAFLARTVPRELAATAQGVVATGAGVVMALASGTSGWLYAVSGSQAYLAMAAMALAACGCALWAHRLGR
jgi:PPP family 3-phenylpropionic acid transporter